MKKPLSFCEYSQAAQCLRIACMNCWFELSICTYPDHQDSENFLSHWSTVLEGNRLILLTLNSDSAYTSTSRASATSKIHIQIWISQISALAASRFWRIDLSTVVSCHHQEAKKVSLHKVVIAHFSASGCQINSHGLKHRISDDGLLDVRSLLH